MLDARNHQGKFGEDYVRALASAAGLIVHQCDVDMDGVDLGFRLPVRMNGVASPMMEAQVKSWSQAVSPSADGEWRFGGLNEDQFNKLAGDDYTVPRFLFLVRVPSNIGEYAEFRTEGMLLRKLAYYTSLRHEPLIENPSNRRKRSVRVPTANVLTTGSLLRLVRSVRFVTRSMV